MPTRKQPPPRRRTPSRKPKPAWQPVLDAVHGLGVQFHGLEARFDGLEARFDGRFETMEGQFQALELRLSDKIQALDGRVERGVESTRAMVEDMRALGNVTIDGVAAARRELRERLDALTARVDVLWTAVHQNSADIRDLKAEVGELKTAVQQNSTDIQALEQRMRAVEGLEARVAQVERRLA